MLTVILSCDIIFLQTRKRKEKRLMKKMTVTIKLKQHYQSKMSPEELQEHLKMKRNGASTTKNGKLYKRKDKYNKKW